jgi:hypothetical protein
MSFVDFADGMDWVDGMDVTDKGGSVEIGLDA